VITIGVCESSSDAALGGAEHARRMLIEAGAGRVIGVAPDLWDILEDL
jgi:hypothetical protein